MTWTTTGDPDAFLDAAGAFLRAAPAANSVTLTTVEALRARGAGAGAGGAERPPLLAWWRVPGEAVTGTAMHTPPYPLHLSAMPPDATSALAGLLAARGHALPGVNGEAAATGAFAAAWSARTGASARVYRRMRLHRLDALVQPDPPPPGSAVVAGPRHRGLLVAWFAAFAAEIEEPPRDHGATVDDRLSHAGLALWIVDGEAVSLAGTTRAVAGAARVAPVYTPPEHRGRGYAAGVTAAVTRAALASGVEEVLLYTDLANPTSNRLYARLGYRPVEDSVSFAFDG
jgi:GNAT superfamily N-acetyltransferase